MTTELSMTRGDSATFTSVVTRSGAAVNLTAGTVWFTAKYRASDADAAAVFQKLTGAGVTGDAGGTVTVTLSPADTAGLPAYPTTLVWDLQLRESDGRITTVDMGTLTVAGDVTHGTA